MTPLYQFLAAQAEVPEVIDRIPSGFSAALRLFGTPLGPLTAKMPYSVFSRSNVNCSGLYLFISLIFISLVIVSSDE